MLSNTVVFKGLCQSVYPLLPIAIVFVSLHLSSLSCSGKRSASYPCLWRQSNKTERCGERQQPATGEVWAKGNVQKPVLFKWGRHMAEMKQSKAFVIGTETMSSVPGIKMNGKKEYWLEVSSVNYQNWKWDKEPKVWKKEKLQFLTHLLFLIHFHLETRMLPFQSDTYEQVGAGDWFDDWN